MSLSAVSGLLLHQMTSSKQLKMVDALQKLWQSVWHWAVGMGSSMALCPRLWSQRDLTFSSDGLSGRGREAERRFIPHSIGS